MVVKLVATSIARQVRDSLLVGALTASSAWIGSVARCRVRGYLNEAALAFLGSVLTAPPS